MSRRTITFTVDDFEYAEILRYARMKGHGGRSTVSSFARFAIRKQMNTGLTMMNEENITIRKSRKYKKWVKSVLVRDNHTCQKCGRTDSLHSHHIKSFSEFPALRLEISNGTALCESCHINERRDHGRNAINTVPTSSDHYLYLRKA
jgi:hypothetical protein